MTAEPLQRFTRHEILVSAPVKQVYDLVADVQNWPQLFPPTVWAQRLEGNGEAERIQIWATANGEVKSWTSRRRLDPDAGRVEFSQEVSTPPVASMGGAWIMREVSAHETRVVLEHNYTAVGDDPDNVAWIKRAIDRNSDAELDALRSAAESEAGEKSCTLSFADGLTFPGSVLDVFEFINRADLWPERLPHVSRVDFRAAADDVQTLEMDTRTKDGATHTTRSIRVCFPHRLIAYKQLVLPPLLNMHTGRWLIEPAPNGQVTLNSIHSFAVQPDKVHAILGETATIADAKQFVRTALSGNSLATMRLARDFTAKVTPRP